NGVGGERKGQPLDGTGDARNLRDDAVGDNRAGDEDRRFPELHEPVGVVLQEAHQIAQMADPRAQIPWNCLPIKSFSSFTSRASAADCASALPVAAAAA